MSETPRTDTLKETELPHCPYCAYNILAHQLEREVASLKAQLADLVADIVYMGTQLAEAREHLESERIRLAACSIAALSDTEESSKVNRLLSDSPYHSASYNDVCRRTDECIELRKQLAEARGLNEAAWVYMAWAAKHLVCIDDIKAVKAWLSRHEAAKKGAI